MVEYRCPVHGLVQVDDGGIVKVPDGCGSLAWAHGFTLQESCPVAIHTVGASGRPALGVCGQALVTSS